MNRRAAALLCLFFAVPAFLAFQVYKYAFESIPDMYRQGWVSGMVVTHMEMNEGRWPRSWEDLKGPYEISVAKAGQPWQFSELRDRVDVDFSVNPDTLPLTHAEEGNVPFRVITLKSGKRSYWGGSDPNFNIWRYLQNRRQKSRPAGI